jgi:hypothetical protein
MDEETLRMEERTQADSRETYEPPVNIPSQPQKRKVVVYHAGRIMRDIYDEDGRIIARPSRGIIRDITYLV